MVRHAMIALALTAQAAVAQEAERDQFFADYATYDSFVTETVEAKDFATFVTRLGGRGTYAEGQLDALRTQFLNIYAGDFTGNTTFQEDLGGGVTREGRVFWTEDEKLLFYAATLLERDGTITILTFNMGADPAEILDRF
ncbi:hypothetical protein [Pseudooceanicola sp.]|uniref:hypothetical protein n=1 Tax=Pseudooceanicola sp. TaxID=1914328 RepID=UPI004058346C